MLKKLLNLRSQGDAEMSFMDHLEELRWHVVRVLLAIIGVGVVLFLNKGFLFDTVILGPKNPDFFTYRAMCWLTHRFNLGEATVSRCVLRYCGAGGRTSAGVGYVLGRDPERAVWVARLDALLQHDEHHADLMRDVIAPLQALVDETHAQEIAQTAASRVQFYTLRPESAETAR